MKEPDEIRHEFVQQWLSKAESDCQLAKYLLAANTPFYEAIGMHCQQAAEKYLKAFLVYNKTEFPKTHHLGELLNLMKGLNPELAGKLQEITILNPYAVDYRYPTDVPAMTLTDAKKAVELAEMVRDMVGKMLE
jgi:HEPN domain-containing protein